MARQNFVDYVQPNPEHVRVLNNADGQVTISSVSLSGEDTDWLTPTGMGEMNTSLGLGMEAELSCTVQPTSGLSAGTYEATIEVTYHQEGALVDEVATAKVSFTVLSSYPVLELADAADNTTAIAAAEGKTYKVTLSGRTLYKDGDWNTLCLPFDATLTGDLAGATVMELDTEGTYEGHKTGLDGTTLYLYFKNATSIEAGKPYIVKWTTTGDPIENPVFTGVTIVGAGDKGDLQSSLPARFTGGQFVGTYSPVGFEKDDKSKLFLGAANTLYWPNADMTVNAFRAYFDLGNATARSFVLNFSDGTGSAGVSPAIIADEDVRAPKGWYSLDGRKLDGKPTKAGLYIHNGRKVAIH